MRTPAFWAGHGAIATALTPFGQITQRITAKRLRQPGFHADVPVICVGNPGVGGSGKTIVAQDLLGRLPGRPFALTRGYKGRLAGPLRVDASHTASDVGDEALLLARLAPTILARDRAAGARLAVTQGASCIVMDDGLQNPGLHKTFSLLVIDGGYGFGNALLLPAGPLREPVAAAASRCQAAVLIGPDQTSALAALPADLPVLCAALIAASDTKLENEKIVAFAGIGRPAKFFDSARSLGTQIVATIPFPDHHHYTEADSARLLDLSAKLGATLLTTEKDFMKLPPALALQTHVLRVKLVWEDAQKLDILLSGIV